MTAELYQPGLPISSFGILLGDKLEPQSENIAYLVEDLGDVYPIPAWDPCFSQPEIKSILDYIRAKGYDFVDPENVFGNTKRGFVLHDLDTKAMNFSQAGEVSNGVINRGGKFAHLAAIYERFKQPEYCLIL